MKIKWTDLATHIMHVGDVAMGDVIDVPEQIGYSLIAAMRAEAVPKSQTKTTTDKDKD